MAKKPSSKSGIPGEAGDFAAGKRFFTEARQYFVAVAAMLGSIVAVQKWIPQIKWNQPLFYLTLVPLLLVFLFKTLPRWWRARRERVLIQRSKTVDAAPQPTAEPLGGYFLIGPYPEDRREHFQRADGVHEIVLRWIHQTREVVLVLTGSSGTGKSSLLQAYVIPELRQDTPPLTVLLLRSYEDPLVELRRQLTAPGVIWEKTPADAANQDWTALLPRTILQLRRKNADARLLVILDQFEELIILDPAGQGAARQTAMREFIQGLRQSPPAGFALLLSLRTDYKIFLERLGVPILQQTINWQEVPAFRQSDAGEFLTAPATGLQIPDDRLVQILTEASAVDGTQGLIRPIILNMLGVVLRRIAGTPAAARPTQTLLADDLRRVVNDSPNHELARPILREMLTAADTKRPQTIGELAQATGKEPDAIQGCLYDLELSGYVRPLHRPEDIRARVWEISHDFVARLLGPILKIPYRTAGQRTAGALYPVALAAWVMVIVLAFMWKGEQAKLITPNAIEMLHTNFFITVKLSPTGDYHTADLEPGDGQNLDSEGLSNSILYLTKVSPPVQELNLMVCREITNVDSLNRLTSLKSLNLSICDKLIDVNGLKGLSNLQSLDLNNCRELINVDGLKGLSSLQILGLYGCSALANVDGLLGVNSLTYLDMHGCSELTNVDGLNGLFNLTNLHRQQNLWVEASGSGRRPNV